MILIGKLRRSYYPPALITYDATHGIRVHGEDAPCSPQGAAAWCRRAGGWLRVRKSAKREVGPVRDFIKTWHKLGLDRWHDI